MTITELKKYGLEEMRDEEVTAFLENQSVGVLGLASPDGPYLVPLSYAYDGESSLYFTYVLGEDSQKGTLTADAERARFLVYSVDTMFNWQSVLLTGTFTDLPPSQWGDISELLDSVWRPEIFQTSKTSHNITIYEFSVEEQSGIKHSGLAPDME
jgi:nitroimidazol reductase NimA-like FMN-containing flavoprotein (pyridoxamine 5'-phosphate oxidase superfamily)